MDALDDRLMAAWRTASSDLGFRLVSPFSAKDRIGKTVSVEGYLPDFGGPEGTVLVSFARRMRRGALKLPMAILPKEDRKYARKSVMATLSDLGWFGVGDAPPWLNVRFPPNADIAAL